MSDNNKFLISLNNVDDIKKFNRIVSVFDEEIDVVSGRFIVDAKSIMGIFALDLSKPVEVEILTELKEAQDKFADAITEFRVR